MSTPTIRRSLRLGTRGSALARAQSGLVADAVFGPVELVEITTKGDRSSAPLATLGGTGVFVSALREALLTGEIDLAVHSYKDLPSDPAPGLRVVAIPERADPRDALLARDGLRLMDLPVGATVGTGAPRRVAQLLAARPDLRLVAIRGNVDTRLRMVADGRLDAVVLAAAGLARLGLLDGTGAGPDRGAGLVAELLDPAVMMPAPAQGALAVECRSDDCALAARLAALDHPASRAAITAERAFLATLEAGCSAPLGALARDENDTLVLRGVVASPDGVKVVRREATGSITDAERLGHGLATELLAAGVSDLLGSS